MARRSPVTFLKRFLRVKDVFIPFLTNKLVLRMKEGEFKRIKIVYCNNFQPSDL